MTTPTFQQCYQLISTPPGPFGNQTLSSRLMSLWAVISTQQNPDGTTWTPSSGATTGVLTYAKAVNLFGSLFPHGTQEDRHLAFMSILVSGQAPDGSSANIQNVFTSVLSGTFGKGIAPIPGAVTTGTDIQFPTTRTAEDEISYLGFVNTYYPAHGGDHGTRIYILPSAKITTGAGGLLKLFGDNYQDDPTHATEYRDMVVGFIQDLLGDTGQSGNGVMWIASKATGTSDYAGRTPDIAFTMQDGAYVGGRFVRLPEYHWIGATNGSATVTDPLAYAAMQGLPIAAAGFAAGTTIPAATFVGTVTPGVGYLLSSSATAQVDVLATVTQSCSVSIGAGPDRMLFVVGPGRSKLGYLDTLASMEVQGNAIFSTASSRLRFVDGAGTLGNALLLDPTDLQVNISSQPVLKAKAGGSVVIGGTGVNATNATSGFLETPTVGAPPTGVPAADAHKAPVVVEDDATPHLWVYVPSLAAWYQVGVSAAGTPGLKDVQVFNTPGSSNWTPPAWAGPLSTVTVHVFAAGGGGGGGRRADAATVRRGGDSGAGGGYSFDTFVLEDLTTPVNVTVGAGGLAGNAATGDNQDGGPGGNGNPTYFGATATTALVRANVGVGGLGGTNTTSAGAATAGAGNLLGGTGVAASATGLVGSAGNSAAGPPSGGTGGGLTTGNAASAGGNGAVPNTRVGNIAASGGAVGANGNPGTTPVTHSPMAGGSGSGGGSGQTTAGGGATAAGNGGAGKNGSGGGGGGASESGHASGTGGPGGDGLIIVITSP